MGPQSRIIRRPDLYQGLSQVFWSDGVYVKLLTEFASLATGALEKIALGCWRRRVPGHSLTRT